MKMLSHLASLLSITIAAVLAPGAAMAGAPAASPYYGRWTISEDRPTFTARGRLYKAIDIAPCGRDFCGVSVGDTGECGPVLFRFLSAHADGETMLHGHGRWGAAKKNVQISTWKDEDVAGGRRIELYLGDGYDFGERSGSMPKFHAMYGRTGESRCTTR